MYIITELVINEFHYICCRELQKSGISGNTQAIEEILELPRQLRKTQEFLEMTRQLRKFLIYLRLLQFWEIAHH
jgi:hypothetical protein